MDEQLLLDTIKKQQETIEKHEKAITELQKVTLTLKKHLYMLTNIVDEKPMEFKIDELFGEL